MPDNAPANQPYALENPFLESLDVAIVEWQPDLVRMSLMPQAAHVNNTGVVQGGILATLLDAAAGYAGLFPENGVRRAATTISLNVNYVSSAQVEPLQVVGRRVGGGRRAAGVYLQRRNHRQPWPADRHRAGGVPPQGSCLGAVHICAEKPIAWLG